MISSKISTGSADSSIWILVEGGQSGSRSVVSVAEDKLRLLTIAIGLPE